MDAVTQHRRSYMTIRKSHRDQDIRRVYFMGAINIHIIAGGDEAPEFAIETGRLDRTDQDKIWSIINELSPSEYRRLNQLIARAIAKFKKPGELNPWPFKRQ